MENKVKRDTTFINLVSEFESRFEQGDIRFLNEKVLLQLVDYYEDEYLFDKAIEVVNIAIDQYKYRSDFYIIKARLELNMGSINDALSTLMIAENFAPYERDIQMLKVRIFAMKKEFDKAQNIIDDIKETSILSDQVDVLIGESFIHENMKDYNAMYDTMAEAIRLDSKNEEAMERIWISAELSRRYEDSVKLHLDIIENDPYNFQAWYNLGHGYTCIWEYEKAIEAMEYSFIINPEFESAYLDCADTCRQVKDFEKALEIYNEAYFKFGANHELMVNIAQCNISLNRISIAKQWLLKAIKVDAYNDEAYFLLGECYASDQTWYNAINAYHKAIQLEARREEYYLGLAKSYMAVEDYNKATVNFQLATQTGPEDTLYWREYVSFLIKLGLLEEAEQILDEADDYTYGADLVYCRAALYYLRKNKSECVTLLEEALIEDFAMHQILFELVPELHIDKEIQSMIKYFED